MKLLISEYSSGFADSTYPLCNELSKYKDLDITYISDKNNRYLNMINRSVKKNMIFDVFANDCKHKKGSIRWAINRIRVAISNCRKRNAYVKKNKPDVTLIELTMTAVDCYFIKKIKPYTKLVYTVHDVIVPMKSLSWNRDSLKKMYDVADMLVVHTAANREQLILEFGIESKKIQVIPHGVDIFYNKLKKSKCRERLEIGVDEKVLLFYGGIRESKGLDILLSAMKNIKATLIIAGALPYGETFDRYRNLIKKNNIRTVEYLTFTDDDFRDILFQAADYLVLPYKEFSSQSGVLMQSIRYHLPVIASDVGAFKEYINKYDIGYCCKANNVENLHDVIIRALDENKNYEKKMTVAAKENSWENAGKLYERMLIRTGGSR